MDRRDFLGGSIGTGIALGVSAGVEASAQVPSGATSAPALPPGVTASAYANTSTGFSPFTTPDYYTYANDLVMERNRSGKPHTGKVLAAVQAHSDDIPLFAGGLVAKLIDEGYTGYLIRISNDEASGKTLGYGVVDNERDLQNVATGLGCKKAYSFYYRNHRMDDSAAIDIRARLIFLFRVLQPDTIIAMDPYNHYDENPDHGVAARVVEAACWLSGAAKDYPEHYKAGLKPTRIRDKYYHARSPQGHNLVNRIVDVSSYIDQKTRGNVANRSKGPAGANGSRLRKELAAQGRRLPLLGDDDATADFQYVKHFLMEDWRLLGKRFGLEYAEAFRYIGPPSNYSANIRRAVDEQTVPL